MKKEYKKKFKHLLKNISILLSIILALALIDFIVLRQVYDPIIKSLAIPESVFTLTVFGKVFYLLLWHIIFTALAIGVFLFLGIIKKSWRLFVSGVILIATGWEDIIYYFMQLRKITYELTWLDYSPIMTLTRFITQTEHVTSTGIIISAIVGLIVVVMILYFDRKK
ncbi:MAG: hypothetical protein WCP89_00770 [archaeon]